MEIDGLEDSSFFSTALNEAAFALLTPFYGSIRGIMQPSCEAGSLAEKVSMVFYGIMTACTLPLALLAIPFRWGACQLASQPFSYTQGQAPEKTKFDGVWVYQHNICCPPGGLK